MLHDLKTQSLKHKSQNDSISEKNSAGDATVTTDSLGSIGAGSHNTLADMTGILKKYTESYSVQLPPGLLLKLIKLIIKLFRQLIGGQTNTVLGMPGAANLSDRDGGGISISHPPVLSNQQEDNNVYDLADSRVVGEESAPPSVDNQLMTDEFNKASLLTTSLVESSPFEKRGTVSFAEQKEQLLKQREHLLGMNNDELESPSSLNGSMAAGIQEQVETLDKHLVFIEGLIENDFSSMENLIVQKQRQTETGVELLNRAIHDKTEQMEQAPHGKQSGYLGSINKYRQLLSDFEERRLSDVNVESAPHNISLALKENKQAMVTALKSTGMSSKAIKKNWKKVDLELTNRRGWSTISKPIILRGAEQSGYESRIKPAAEIRFHSGGRMEDADTTGRDPFESSYIGGIYSSPTPTQEGGGEEHALNLHQTSLVATGNSKELFAGIRSGTIATRKVPDPDKWDRSSESWAKETVTTALIHKLERSPELYEQVKEGKPIEIKLGATSLLTPDRFRDVTGIGDSERSLQKKQYEALHGLANSGKPLTVYDADGNKHEIKIALDVATMNVGVNIQSLSDRFDMVMGTRSKADEYTEEGLKKIMGSLDPDQPLGGWTGQWLADNPDAPGTSVVKQLGDQIRHIYNDKLHHHEDQDAYKLATRIPLLLHEINAVPQFNCKSGKDRTGEADARIKELAFETACSGGVVPESDAQWSPERREQLQAFLYGAGEQELIMNNVGTAKLKTTLGKGLQGEELFKFLHS